MLITKARSSPVTPVRSSVLHSMMMAASWSPSTRSATRIRSVPGNDCSGPGTGSWLTITTSLPSASSANAMASCDPMASPSGRTWELITNRWRAWIASAMRPTISRRSSLIGLAVGNGVLVSPRLGSAPGVLAADFLEQLLDPRLVVDGLVVREGQLRHAPEPQPLPEGAAQEGQRPLERAGGPLPRGGVAERGGVHARLEELLGDAHARQRHEADARVAYLARQQLAELLANLFPQPLRPVHSSSTSLRVIRPGSACSIAAATASS